MFWVSSCLVMSDTLQPHGLYSPPGSSVHGIFQARILEWGTISFSRGTLATQGLNLGLLLLLHWQMGSLPLVPPGKPSPFGEGANIILVKVPRPRFLFLLSLQQSS